MLKTEYYTSKTILSYRAIKLHTTLNLFRGITIRDCFYTCILAIVLGSIYPDKRIQIGLEICSKVMMNEVTEFAIWLGYLVFCLRYGIIDLI